MSNGNKKGCVSNCSEVCSQESKLQEDNSYTSSSVNCQSRYAQPTPNYICNINNCPQVASQNTFNIKEDMELVDITTLLRENEMIKRELSKIKLEQQRLSHANGSNTQENIEIKNLLNQVEVLKNIVNSLNEKKLKLQEKLEEVEISHCDPTCSSLNSVEPPLFSEARDSLSQLSEKIDSTGETSNKQEISISKSIDTDKLISENSNLQELILQFQLKPLNQDEANKNIFEIAKLKNLLKQKKSELCTLRCAKYTESDSEIENLNNRRALLIKEYDHALSNNNILAERLLEQSEKVNQRLTLIANLQETMKQLNLELEHKMLQRKEIKLNEELENKIVALKNSISKIEHENESNLKRISIHNNCEEKIHNLNVELVEKTLLLAKLKTEYKNALQAKNYNVHVEYENKVNDLGNKNTELQKEMEARDVEIENLKYINDELNKELKKTKLSHEKDLRHHDRSLVEISSLYKNIEDEVIDVESTVKHTSNSIDKVKSENEKMRKILEEKGLFLQSEKVQLEQQILEQQNKSSTFKNLQQYATKINDLDKLNEEYMRTIKSFSQLCNLLNEKNEEVNELKFIINNLLQCMDKKFSESNDIKINSVQISNIIECISNFYDITNLKEENSLNRNNNFEDEKQFCKCKIPKSNQLVKSLPIDQLHGSDDLNNLLLQREYLKNDIHSINEKLKLILKNPTHVSMCSNCNGILSNQNECLVDESENSSNACWIGSANLLRQIASDLNQIKQHLIPNLYEHRQIKRLNNVTRRGHPVSTGIQNYVLSLKELLKKAANITEEINEIEKTL